MSVMLVAVIFGIIVLVGIIYFMIQNQSQKESGSFRISNETYDPDAEYVMVLTCPDCSNRMVLEDEKSRNLAKMTLQMGIKKYPIDESTSLECTSCGASNTIRGFNFMIEKQA